MSSSEKRPGIYVEIAIRGAIDDIWRRTQNPDLHEPWDLRFTSIEYLPRASENDPQQFLYATRIGFGLAIRGAGESTGDRSTPGRVRTSALRFWSDERISLIREGSGYWRYEPVDERVRFLTWYDYRVRFGTPGIIVDRIAFRPLIGWATAWSFDRLRMWIETGIHPRQSMQFAAMAIVARIAIAFTWIWQGAMPKLLFPSPDERFLMRAAGAPEHLLAWVGLAEVLFGLVTLLWPRNQVFLLNAVLMIVTLAPVAFTAPQYLVASFNPVTLNAGMLALSIVGWLAGKEAPSARRCRRSPEGSE